jgi:hypothetical protein
MMPPVHEAADASAQDLAQVQGLPWRRIKASQ